MAIGNWDWVIEQTEFTITGGPGNASVNSATVDSITDTKSHLPLQMLKMKMELKWNLHICKSRLILESRFNITN